VAFPFFVSFVSKDEIAASLTTPMTLERSPCA
jgi:hypothetical protein